MPASRKLVRQYSGPKDLLDRLDRDLQRVQQAPTPTAALDAAITYCCTAWSLTAWLYAPIYRDAQARRQLAHLVDRGMASIDLEVFGGLVAELCPNLALCAAVASDPTKLAVESTGTGWLLLFLEDGERKPIGLQRFEGVVVFWQQFVRKYLGNQPDMFQPVLQKVSAQSSAVAGEFASCRRCRSRARRSSKSFGPEYW